MDLNAELREYQWRRKFESDHEGTLRVFIIAAILLLILIVSPAQSSCGNQVAHELLRIIIRRNAELHSR